MWLSNIFNKLNNAIDTRLEKLFGYWEAVEERRSENSLREHNNMMLPEMVIYALNDSKGGLVTPEKIREAVTGYFDKQYKGEFDADYIEKAVKYAQNMDGEKLAYESELFNDPQQKAFGERHDELTKARLDDMARWDALSDAVGGDLFDDPRKLAAMRSVDFQGKGGRLTAEEFQEFHDLVVEKIYTLPLVERPEHSPV